ncbi:hypothetical protein D3C80_1785870 [compost metagenome]
MSLASCHRWVEIRMPLWLAVSPMTGKLALRITKPGEKSLSMRSTNAADFCASLMSALVTKGLKQVSADSSLGSSLGE